MTDLVTRARDYLVTNAAESGADMLIEQLADEIEQLYSLLEQHHTHHLHKGSIGLPDGDGGWIEIDNGAEYSDSILCHRTCFHLLARRT